MDGDVMGVVFEKTGYLTARKCRTHRMRRCHIQDYQVVLIQGRHIPGSAQNGGHTTVHDIDVTCRYRGCLPCDGPQAVHLFGHFVLFVKQGMWKRLFVQQFHKTSMTVIKMGNTLGGHAMVLGTNTEHIERKRNAEAFHNICQAP